MTFPERFWWGAGSSDLALRGPAPASDHHQALHPPSAPVVAAVEDRIDPVASLGLGHRRTVAEWARLEPEPGRHDQAELEDLRRRLAADRDAGIATWGCLHDVTLPGWFAVDERGFADDRSRGYFWDRHVEWVGEAVGDLVHGWIPSFEPNRWALRGWISGSHAPHRQADVEGFTGALVGVLAATVSAARRLGGGGQPVASAHWAAPVAAARRDPRSGPTAEAEVLADRLDGALHRSWVRLLSEEVLAVPGRADLPVPGAREAFSVVGFTYRGGLAVDAEGAITSAPPPRADGTDTAWSEGFGLALHRLAGELDDRPLLAAGVSLATNDEDERARYLRDVLAIAAEGLTGGIDLRGLWWTDPLDQSAGAGRRGLLEPGGRRRPAADLWAEVVGGGPIPAAGDA